MEVKLQEASNSSVSQQLRTSNIYQPKTSFKVWREQNTFMQDREKQILNSNMQAVNSIFKI